MTGFRERLEQEKLDLGDKTQKLSAFLKSGEFLFLRTREKLLLKKQLITMREYHGILTARLNYL